MQSGGSESFDIFTMLLITASIFSLNLLTLVHGQDVMGCGGFIHSQKNIDFSRIQVELYMHAAQPQGGGTMRRVGSTDAAPNNGYYFIPVEEAGEYLLKPVAPLGWKIEPEERHISIDGKSADEKECPAAWKHAL